MKPLVHSIGKNALIVLLVSIGGNLVLYGPEATWKRGVAMYEKPESTLYPLKVVLGWCLPKTFRCMTNSNCRKTVGEMSIYYVLFSKYFMSLKHVVLFYIVLHIMSLCEIVKITT